MLDWGASWRLSLLVAKDIEQAPDQAAVLGLIFGDEPVEALGSAPFEDFVPSRFETLACALNQEQSLLVEPSFVAKLCQEPAERGLDLVEAMDEVLPADTLMALHLDPVARQIGLLQVKDGGITQRLWLDFATKQQSLSYSGSLASVPDDLLAEVSDSALSSEGEFAEGLVAAIGDEPEMITMMLEAWALAALAEVLGFGLAEAPDDFWQTPMQVFELA